MQLVKAPVLQTGCHGFQEFLQPAMVMERIVRAQWRIPVMKMNASRHLMDSQHTMEPG